MELHRHFGLERAPFESAPDADFFVEAHAHAEALATLEYTCRARKGCCLVLGESGTGKTLLARMAADRAGKPVIWIQGAGQTGSATEAIVLGPRRGTGTDRDSAVHTSLAQWARWSGRRNREAIVIVDDADELPAACWREIIALVTREARTCRPVTLALFGAPDLLEILSAPELLRLQRRVFRVCRLAPIPPSLTKEYVHRRIAVAGGDGPKLFDESTLSQIYKLTGGNPAQLNRLCDNALVEAFSAERDRVTVADIGNALYAIIGGNHIQAGGLPAPLRCNGSPVAADRTEPGLLERVPDTFGRIRVRPPALPAPREPGADAVAITRSAPRAALEQPLDTQPAGAMLSEDPQLQSRLQSMEFRLAQAMDLVREARDRDRDIRIIEAEANTDADADLDADATPDSPVENLNPQFAH